VPCRTVKSFIVAALVATLGAHAVAFEFTPDRHSVPLTGSVELEGRVDDFVEFLYNRGKGSVSYRDTLLKMLTPEYLRALPHFKSFKTTRVDISAYEFRLVETIPLFEVLLKRGVQLRVVSDPATFTPFEAFNARKLKSLSDTERAAYLKAYDRDRDGQVSDADVERVNEDRFVAIRAHEHLESLRQRFPKLVTLVNPPNEEISRSELLPFPRLHHLKDVAIDFFRDGKWRSQISLRSSANPTDSCMSKRIDQDHDNKVRYTDLDFAHTKFARGSQGNVQFGALLRGEVILESIQSIKEKWIALYKRKKHFDEGRLDPTILPRIVINDSRGYRSTLETYYSEGIKAEGRKTLDPVLTAIHHLSGPDKSLRVHYSTQFVSTHPAKNQALRYLIDRAGDQMEDFFVLVDGNFATQPYSALPQLAFAPSLSLQFGTLEGRSIRDLPALPGKLNWESAIGVYEGGQENFGHATYAGSARADTPFYYDYETSEETPADKLHAKVDYYEYETLSGERHYLVVWGSANSSKNAARGNADVLHVLDTTDPSVGKTVKRYFEGLRTDSRVFPFSQAYLDRRFREAFHWDQRILHEDFLRDFAEYLSAEKKPKGKLTALVAELAKAKSHTDFGANFLRLLKWYDANVSAPLGWADLYALVELSQPQKLVPDAIAADMAARWQLEEGAPRRALVKTLASLRKKESFGAISRNMGRILSNCSVFLQRLGVRQKPSALFTGTE